MNKLILLLILLPSLSTAKPPVVVYPTIRGTHVPDYTKKGYVIKDYSIYPVIRGTHVPDYTKPGYRYSPNRRTK